jgi:hypothetical protein
MNMNNNPAAKNPSADSERVRVMIEPVDGVAEAKVMNQLGKIGATRVHQIAQGFVSAEVSVADIPGLKEIARTGILPPKQLRTLPG